VAGTGAVAAQTMASVDYDLQRRVRGLVVPARVTVIGTGGYGSWTALFAALSGVSEMRLIDSSDVSARDLARTPFRPADVGKPKAEVMADLIAGFRPEVVVKPEKRFVEPSDDDVFFGEVLFDGTDYQPLAESLPRQTAERGMRYVHGFYRDTLVGTVTDKYLPELHYESGNETPVWVGGAALSALLGLFSAFVKPFAYAGSPPALGMTREEIAAAVAAQGDGTVDK